MKSIRSPLSAIFALLSGGLAAVFLLWVISCGKDKAATAPTATNSNFTATDRGCGDGECYCEYKILAIQVDTPDGYPHYNVELKTPYDNCGSSCACNLNLFGWYSSNGSCGSSELCAHNFSGTLPTGWQPFNCNPPAFGGFTITTAFQAVNNSCGHTNADSWKMWYKIRCLDNQPTENGCPEDNGYQTPPVWVESDEIFVEGGPSKPFGPEMPIGLGGCGCTPQLGI